LGVQFRNETIPQARLAVKELWAVVNFEPKMSQVLQRTTTDTIGERANIINAVDGQPVLGVESRYCFCVNSLSSTLIPAST
jgi:hypothetical protein